MGLRHGHESPPAAARGGHARGGRRRLRRRAWLGGLALAVALASPAYADDPVSEGVVEQSCRSLEASTVGDPQDFTQNEGPGITATWPEAPAGLLPAAPVALRTATETFNRRYEFATRQGRIFGRNRGDSGPWREMTLPPCFAGRVASIALDDDEMIALDAARRVFTMDNALKDATLFNWSSRWGTPFWTGLGYSLPGGVLAWSWSVISPEEDKTWTDPAGNHMAVGGGKVSHIWGLRDGGQRLTFWDPWLPLDESYEMCGPVRGRFKAINLSASGSFVFVIGPRGDMFTRIYDFDLSGHDSFFFKYSYEDQRGKGDTAPIQLPAAPWVKQPKIPGPITSTISIHKVGIQAVHRILRVEGESGGQTGYWERDVASPVAAGWSFHPTGLPLTGKRLDNSQSDTSERDLGAAEDNAYKYVGKDMTAELLDYNVYCSPAHLRVTKDGKTQDLLLHHVDALRQHARGRGLDDTPRAQDGVIAFPGGKFETANVEATRDQIVLKEQGWTFKREPTTAAGCLPQRATIGPRSVGAVRLGLSRESLLRRVPEPGTRTPARWRWCVGGGGLVTAVFARDGRLALIATTAPGHARRGLHAGSAVSEIRRVYPRTRSLGRGLLHAGPGSRALFVLRRGRIARVVVAARATIARPALLRRYLAS